MLISNKDGSELSGNERSLLRGDVIVVQVVIQDAVAHAELQVAQEFYVVHNIKAVEDIEASAVGNQVASIQQGVLHHLCQFVHRCAVVIQVGHLTTKKVRKDITW